MKLFYFPPELKPAGDVNIEIMDYAKWLQMHLRGLRGEDNYISSESYHYLHFGLDAYALGWGNFEFDEQNHLSAHQGSDFFFLARAIILPEQDLAFFILTNVGDDEGVDYLNAKLLKKYAKKWYLMYTLPELHYQDRQDTEQYFSAIWSDGHWLVQSGYLLEEKIPEILATVSRNLEIIKEQNKEIEVQQHLFEQEM